MATVLYWAVATLYFWTMISKKEPPHLCPQIYDVQHLLSSYLIEYEVPADSELYDVLMAACAHLDITRLRIMDLRAWGKQQQKIQNKKA